MHIEFRDDGDDNDDDFAHTPDTNNDMGPFSITQVTQPNPTQRMSWAEPWCPLVFENYR